MSRRRSYRRCGAEARAVQELLAAEVAELSERLAREAALSAEQESLARQAAATGEQERIAADAAARTEQERVAAAVADLEQLLGAQF